MNRGLWILLGLFVLIFAVVAAYMIGSSTTNQRRLAARVQREKRGATAQAAAAERRREMRGDQAEVVSPPLATEELQSLLDAMDTIGRQDTEWRELADAIHEANRTWPPELSARVQAWLDQHADLIAQAHALAAGGAVLPDPDLSTPGIRLDHVEKLRAVNWLLIVYAKTLVAQGNTDDAMRVLEDAMAVADLTGSQAFILSQMSRTGDYHRTLNEVADIVARHAVPEDQFNELERRLRCAYQREQFAAAMANEAQLARSMFDDVRESTVGRILVPFVNMNETSYMEGMGELADVAARPYYEIAGELDGLNENTESLSFVHYFSRTMLGMVQPALMRALEDQARHEARVDLARIAIALERHYLETGSYPESLGAVASAFGGNVPRDSFTGQAYMYRPTEDGFLLYGVGSDLADDGGTQEGRDGDIVWGGR